MSGNPCAQCGSAFPREPKSKAMYCSAKCRRSAREAAEQERAAAPFAPVLAILDHQPPPITEIAVVARTTYSIVYTREPEGFAPGQRPWVQDLGSASCDLLQTLLDHPDLLPDEVLAFTPDDPRQALEAWKHHPWWLDATEPFMADPAADKLNPKDTHP